MPDTERTYGTVVTSAGLALVTAATMRGEKVKLKYLAVGDGGGQYYQPSADMTALKNEKWRGEVNSVQINPDSPNMIDIVAVIPATVGGFTIREMSVQTEGDDVMFAVCNTPDTEKAVILEGIAATLTLIMHIVVVDTTVLEFAIDPTLDPVPYEEFVELQTAHEKLLLGIMQGEVTAPLATNTGAAITTQDDAAIVAVKKI